MGAQPPDVGLAGLPGALVIGDVSRDEMTAYLVPVCQRLWLPSRRTQTHRASRHSPGPAARLFKKRLVGVTPTPTPVDQIDRDATPAAGMDTKGDEIESGRRILGG